MGRERVLIVDDHAAFRASAAALLRVEGMDVVATAATGEEALAASAASLPDIVLVDLVLPGMDGVDVANAFVRDDGAPVVILISSHDDAASDPRVRTAPVRGFLAKQDLTCAAIRALVG